MVVTLARFLMKKNWFSFVQIFRILLVKFVESILCALHVVASLA